MIEQTFNWFVFYLSTLPFTTDYALGRIFVLHIILLKRQITSWTGLKNKPTKLTIFNVFLQLWKQKRTPLDTAIRLHDLELVKHFIEVIPANVNSIITDVGSTPLHIAVSSSNFLLQNAKNYLELAKLFIQNGANIDAIDNEGDTALHYAVDSNLIVWIKFLLENGANLNIKNFNADIPLFNCDFIQNDTLVTLVQHGANINALNGNGDTWLHDAIEYENDLEFVELLLSLGASPYTKNIDGFTPIEYALKTNNSKALKMMITYQQSGIQSRCIGETQTRLTYTKMLLIGLYFVLNFILLAMIFSTILRKVLYGEEKKEDGFCSNHIIQCMATEKDFDSVTLFSKETFLKNFYCD